MKTVRTTICLVMMNLAMCFCCRAGIFDNTLHVYKYGPATPVSSPQGEDIPE
jgi:hypothetical protein